MKHFGTLFQSRLKRRSKDFFVLFYNVIFPIIIIALLGYLTSKSYSVYFTSYHYYTVVMIPFCGLMGIITVCYAAQEEKRFKTAYRYITAPISKGELVMAKFLSCVIIFALCSIVALSISKMLFNMEFNGKFLWIVYLLVCESVAVTGIGLFLGLACKRFDILQNFLNLPIVIFGFLGGVFFPVNSYQPILSTIINLSPLTWVNRGIVSCIFDNNIQILWVVSAVFLLFGCIATGLTIKFFKKEAFI